MKQPWYDRFLGKVVFLCSLLLLAFVGVVMIQSLDSYPEAEFLMKSQGRAVRVCLVIVMAVFLFLLLELVYRMLDRAGAKLLQIICVIAPCLLVAGQFCFLLYYRSLYMWDSAYVAGGASTLLTEGAVAPEAVYYYSVYPNQNAFALLTKALLWVASVFRMNGSETLLLCNAVNMIALDVSVFLSVSIWRGLKKECSLKDRAFFWIVLLMQPFFYMGVSYYYTITLSMPFFMGFLYLIFVLFEPKESDQEYVYEDIKASGTVRLLLRNVFLPVLAGILFGLGFLIRATTIIPVIAVLFVSMLSSKNGENNFGKKRGGRLYISLLMLVAGLSVILVLNPLMEKEIGIDTTDTAFPATHWVMMSLTSPGCHNEEDEAYTAGFATAQDKKEAVLSRMKEKLTKLGVSGYFSLLWDKIGNTWADGTNSYVLFMENCLRMDGIYPYLFGNHKDFAVLCQQGMHLLLCAGIFLSVWNQIRKGRGFDQQIFLLQLVLLGGFLFYVLWETSGQYSLPFLLIMLLVSVEGYCRCAGGLQAMPYVVKAPDDFGKKRFYKLLGGAGAVSIVFVLLFFLTNYHAFTGEAAEYKAPVVNQLIANGETADFGEEALCQTFRTNQAFNQLVFQWRNPLGESNQAVYTVTLSGQEEALWTEQISAGGQGYSGAFLYEFPQITPKQETKYTLTIQKTAGDDDSYLQFVKYSCGSYDPYPYGSLTIGGTAQEGDLMFQTSRVRTGAYTTPKRYVFFGGLCMIFFLFLEICCILQIYAFQNNKITTRLSSRLNHREEK